MTLLAQCFCGSEAADSDVHFGIAILRCRECGVVRQDVPMDAEALQRWYETTYHQGGVYSHTYPHDCRVAEQRLDAYRLTGKVLDVGSGNGAFVDRARARGLDAWGVDLHDIKHPHIYTGTLHSVAFPTEEFDVVTMHDVLEHVPDPLGLLQEVRRILRPGGRLIVDYPRFWDEAGRHHWKPVEHLWLLREHEVAALLVRAGFVIMGQTHPIPSKLVVRALAPAVNRPSVLLPPGIGDSYWVLVKLHGLLQEQGLPEPNVYLAEGETERRRADPFLRTVPFVRASGYADRPSRQIRQEAYWRDGRTVYRGVNGMDWFMAYNGVLHAGRRLEDVDVSWRTHWRPRLFDSKEAQEFQQQMRAGGPYCVVHLPSHAFYMFWLHAFGPRRTLETLWTIRRVLNLRIVFTGATWDVESLAGDLAQTEPESQTWVNLIGKTSYDQLSGLLRGASLVFGYPTGATILPSIWYRPTVLLWTTYFPPAFWQNTLAPEGPYAALNAAVTSTDAIIAQAKAMMGRSA